MDTSVTIIGLAITLLIAIPLFFVFRSNAVNKKKIKSIKEQYSENKHYNFSLTVTQNKKVLSLDEQNKGFLFIDFNTENEKISFVNLNEISACKLVLTTENKAETIVKIEFEFESKETSKKELIPFYTIEKDTINQVCLYEDHQLAKKWQKIIENCISK
jgi:hypothetical protein